MQIKKYRVVRKSKGPDNPFHDFINGSIAVPVEFEVGKPGFFVYKYLEDIDIEEWHRVQTSPVLSIKDNVIETKNTLYIFKEI